ncbi:MAG TPA: OmpA family protein [Crocinitomicaceae bacterium]|nr:OmpA family protein [Crocinitomicaceae bacterium]
MKKYFSCFLFGFLGFPIVSLAQEVISSENIADLKGAVEIERNRSYSIDFTGNWGWERDFQNSEIATELVEKNSIFLIKRCQSNSDLVFDLTFSQPTLQLAIFKFDYSIDLKIPALKDMKLVYLSKEPLSSYSNSDPNDENKIPDFKCDKGEAFLIVINNIKKSFGRVTFNLKSSEIDEEVKKIDQTRIFDDRLPDDNTKIYIKIRDNETHLPIIAKVNVVTKKKSSIFTASDIILGSDSKAKAQLICDAEGYFFKDTAVNLTNLTVDTVVVSMQSISVGKSFKIDKIEFVKGTADLYTGAENILRRVKDFLILNSDVRIEVQGHVNAESDESKRALSLSKKRALTIKKYFVKAGINKDRIDYQGFGSRMPIFQNPKNEYEQQANRRVEIKIIE